MSDLYKNFAYCRVASTVSSGATTIVVDNLTNLPTNTQVGSQDFYMVLEPSSALAYPDAHEIVKVTAINSGTNTLTVVRAQEGTTAVAWNVGTLMHSAVTADQLSRAATPILQSYTPSWTSAGTAPALGNGVIYGRYSQVADKVYHIIVGLKMGSTTTFGTGGWFFSLPSGVQVADLLTSGGTYSPTTGFGSAFDVSATFTFPIAVFVNPHTNSTPDVLFPWTIKSGSAPDSGLSSGVPFTWASGDALFLSADVITV